MKNQDYTLRNIFGVVCKPDAAGGQCRILSKSGIILQPILDQIEQGDGDGKLQHRFRMGAKEVAYVRTWHARFGADASAPAALPPGLKAFLLDECVPTSLLPHVKDYFGFSSHVDAEGWARRNPSELVSTIARKNVDTGIAGFAMEQQFAGIITRDNDFQALAKNKEHPAAKVHILLFDGRWASEELRESLEVNRFRVQRALQQEPRVHHIRPDRPFPAV